MLRKTDLLLGALTLSIAAGAMALPHAAAARGGPGGGERPTFGELDRNGDGLLTAEDFAAHAQARFAEADTDGNGLLSADEVRARAAQRSASRAERMIDRLDSNGDGQLSLAEIEERRRGPGPERMIDRFDTDGDGALSAAEFETAVAERGGHRRHGGKGPRRGN
ncbi:hypothetical protein DXV76_01090 [Rhodobacteraceae bacterium CCMM004]|nr:hypothetical protein DXV76_01090 [Rhodobacteraceae bacterium CCMM004]